VTTGPIHTQFPVPCADAPAIPRRGTTGGHQPAAAGGIPSTTPQDASHALVSAPQLSAHAHDDVAVVSLRGELDSRGACILRAHLSEIRQQAWARCVADLADLAFIDSVCLGVLVRHCRQSSGRGGSFALARPQAAVQLVLSATGLLSWFEVHDTLEEAIAGARGRQPADPAAAAARHWARG
jgi:anti-sigma B factor antagonist